VGAADHYPHTPVESREQWRAWLAEHHASERGTWLVTYKRTSGGPYVPYEATVEEALCFGWVDSLGRALDERRSMQLFTPRRTRSRWSRPNKERVERLLAAGSMEPAGLAAVERAKRDGSWTELDDVEALVVPPDLAEAFARHPGAAAHWDGFTRAARRAILEWIVDARRPATRARRIAETAARAAAGERANERRER
jgi:uncharacterized protein YdeI (YjbR/CyaY-like superfamily)